MKVVNKGKVTGTGTAVAELIKERVRLTQVVKETTERLKSKALDVPKVHIDAYEGHLGLTARKRGPDLKNNDVKRSYDALVMELDKLARTYRTITAQLRASRNLATRVIC
ncbi:MAG: hypothetical protein AAGC57_16970 [Pseudomonadota bacterium]